MQPLTLAQLDSLVLESQGRPFSWIDEPEWYCGKRKCTFAARDGVIPEHSQSGGTMQSLAYSMRDKCSDYLQTISDESYFTSRIESLKASLRKTKSKRATITYGRELYIAEQDLRNTLKRRSEMIAKYFRGYESRFMLSQ